MIKLQLIGHLGKDAMQREVNGKSVLGFTVAHTERFRNQQGVQQERTVWVDCSLWERDNVAPYLTVGTQVFVEGMPAVQTYTNQAGETVPALKLNVQHLQLLGGGRRDEERQKATAVPGDTDDLPF
jgi:single-strand DNA-binding protein